MQEKYSIFATVGTAKQPFDRFVRLVDEAAARRGVAGLIQTGFTKTRPSHCDAVAFLSRDEFERRVAEARHVITHAGEGSVISVLRSGKTPILVARRGSLGEHVNDHQVQLTKEFQMLGLAEAGETVEDLLVCLGASPTDPPPTSGFSNAELLRLVETFLEGC
jgi:UDP-N-acetylglucosamine transferase subunit ALG13